MITTAIIGAALTLIEFFVGLLPSWSFSGQTFTGITTYLAQINAFVPLSEMLAMVQLLIAGATVYLGAWLIMRIIDWLPFT